MSNENGEWVSLELAALRRALATGTKPPYRKGSYREIPLTRKDYREYARAEELMEELDSNPWIDYDHHEGFFLRRFGPEVEFIPQETQEEYHQRLRDWMEEL